MFKEAKKCHENPNKVRNEIVLRRITEKCRVDRTETCFGGNSHQTQVKYLENKKKSRVLAKRWY